MKKILFLLIVFSASLIAVGQEDNIQVETIRLGDMLYIKNGTQIDTVILLNQDSIGQVFIRNVSDPVNDLDAVNLRYLKNNGGGGAAGLTSGDVLNITGSTIPAGTVVRLEGSVGGMATITPASNAHLDESYVYGLTLTDIPNNQFDKILLQGKYTGNVVLPVGLELWLGIDGALTTTKPSANAVYLGIVEKNGASGSIIFNPMGGGGGGSGLTGVMAAEVIRYTGTGADGNSLTFQALKDHDIFTLSVDGIVRRVVEGESPDFDRVEYDRSTGTVSFAWVLPKDVQVDIVYGVPTSELIGGGGGASVAGVSVFNKIIVQTITNPNIETTWADLNRTVTGFDPSFEQVDRQYYYYGSNFPSGIPGRLHQETNTGALPDGDLVLNITKQQNNPNFRTIEALPTGIYIRIQSAGDPTIYTDFVTMTDGTLDESTQYHYWTVGIDEVTTGPGGGITFASNQSYLVGVMPPFEGAGTIIKSGTAAFVAYEGTAGGILTGIAGEDFFYGDLIIGEDINGDSISDVFYSQHNKEYYSKNEVDQMISVLTTGIDYGDPIVDYKTEQAIDSTIILGVPYIVAPGATGDWTGHDNEFALATSNGTDTTWTFSTASSGSTHLNLHTGNTTTFNGTSWVTSGIAQTGNSGVPIGTVVAFAGQVVPDGWLLCDGSIIPTNFSELRAEIGLRTPDLRDRFIKGGAITDDMFTKNPYKTGVPTIPFTGTASGQTANSPSHSHSGTTNTTGNHNHSRGTYYWKGAGSGAEFFRGKYNGNSSTTNDNNILNYDGNHSHSLNINSGGIHTHNLTINATIGGGGDSVTEPENIVLMYIIRAL